MRSAARRSSHREGGQYAILVEDPNTDPVIMALAAPDGTCEISIPKDRYEPFEVLAIVKGWEREDAEPNPLWWRVSIVEPGAARTVEVDTPSGWTLPDWQAYAERYHGPECAVNVIAGLPKTRAPINLDEAIRAACDGVAGITPAQFWALLSHEDMGRHRGGRHPPQDLQGVCPVMRRGDTVGSAGSAGGAMIAGKLLTDREAETEDLNEFFEERTAILEHDAGLPRPEAQVEAARSTATLARNRRYTWESLRSTLSGYSALLSQVPDRAGKVDGLTWGGVTTVAVLKARPVLRHGAFVGSHHVTATREDQ
jgi:hypothetical protein